MCDTYSGTPAALPQEAPNSQTASACNSAPAPKLAYSVREVAALTGLGRSTIYVLIGQKKLEFAARGWPPLDCPRGR